MGSVCGGYTQALCGLDSVELRKTLQELPFAIRDSYCLYSTFWLSENSAGQYIVILLISQY